MFEIMMFGILAGVDNLQACSALGLLPLHKRRLHLLAAAFCLSEIGAALLGMWLARSLSVWLGVDGPEFGPWLMLACGVLVLGLAWRGDDERLHDVINQRGWIFGLPLTLSFDNLAAGAGISFSSVPLFSAALAIGVISASMSCIGLYLGQGVRRFLPQKMDYAAGFFLCGLALWRMLMPETAH
ncbi:manganese efflux pump [Massilia sp. W12]|uniref:manganese efflux pump MntP n=1 Tax=Massilia sp. W12 TaxID=3126507 RepID=UPI0030D0DB3B